MDLWNFEEPPEGDPVLEFRLVYRGALPSNGSPKIKHEIRKQFHLQLEQYWKEHPHLRNFLIPAQFAGDPNQAPVMKLANRFRCGPHRFVPLVLEQDDTYCSLNILFLRRGTPGNIVQGGDLDNRLTTLLDALKVPKTTDGLGDSPEAGYDPIYCLMQDDAQITAIQVISDRVLTPLSPEEYARHVTLIIHVHVYRGTNVSQLSGLPGSL